MQDRNRPSCISWERLATCRDLASDHLCSPQGIQTRKVPRPSHHRLWIVWEGREKTPFPWQTVEIVSQAKAGCYAQWREGQ